MSKYSNAPIKLKLVVALINMIVSMTQSNASFNQPLPAPKPGEGDVLCSMVKPRLTRTENYLIEFSFVLEVYISGS